VSFPPQGAAAWPGPAALESATGPNPGTQLPLLVHYWKWVDEHLPSRKLQLRVQHLARAILKRKCVRPWLAHNVASVGRQQHRVGIDCENGGGSGTGGNILKAGEVEEGLGGVCGEGVSVCGVWCAVHPTTDLDRVCGEGDVGRHEVGHHDLVPGESAVVGHFDGEGTLCSWLRWCCSSSTSSTASASSTTSVASSASTTSGEAN
jgi:hypothetical protein